MITVTVRLLARDFWVVQARNQDGTRIVRDGSDVPWRDFFTVTDDLAWEHVGFLLRMEADQAAIVTYVDDRPQPSPIDATIRGTREN